MLHTQVALSRPVTTVMAALALLAVGLISGKLLRLEAMPDISFPGMQIIVPYAGSTPEEMEELVVRPVEEALATLSGIKEIRASAQSDQATFTVLFDWDRDVDAAAFEVRTKLDSIRPQLPVGADRLLMFAFSSGDQPVAVVRISSDKDLTDQYEMLEKYLQRPIERIEGVARVELQGVQPREVRILVDPTRLAAYSVDVRQLRDAARAEQFLGQRRRDHREQLTLHGAPDRRVQQHRRRTQPAALPRRAAWGHRAGRARVARTHGGPPHGGPPCRRHRRVQVDPGQRRRRRRSRPRSRREGPRPAAVPGHQDPGRRQPGRQHPRAR